MQFESLPALWGAPESHNATPQEVAWFQHQQHEKDRRDLTKRRMMRRLVLSRART